MEELFFPLFFNRITTKLVVVVQCSSGERCSTRPLKYVNFHFSQLEMDFIYRWELSDFCFVSVKLESIKVKYLRLSWELSNFNHLNEDSSIQFHHLVPDYRNSRKKNLPTDFEFF